MRTQTLVGWQFWTDVRFTGKWKIQRCANTPHHRLIDENEICRAWGSIDQCQRILDEKVADGTVQKNQGPIVIVIHGLMRTSGSMDRLADYLADRGNYSAVSFQYASTRDVVSQHAADLRHLIDHLGPDVTEINFVTHSLGGIVLRQYLADATDVAAGHQGDARIRRIVMLGPPNQGSKLARILKNNLIFKIVAGAGGGELSNSWKHLESHLATPNCSFGIIAGGQTESHKIGNVFLPGRDDMVIRVDETRLAGADDFIVLPLFHATMMRQPQVMQATLRFLKDGYFISDAQRHALPRVEEVTPIE
jgi:pimeloyl-ACP methyl ester carboxylesterase